MFPVCPSAQGTCNDFRVNAFHFKKEADLFLTFSKCQKFSLYLPRKLLQCMNAYNRFPAKSRLVALNFFVGINLSWFWFCTLLGKKKAKWERLGGESQNPDLCHSFEKTSVTALKRYTLLLVTVVHTECRS